jgi:hypothetical protein
MLDAVPHAIQFPIPYVTARCVIPMQEPTKASLLVYEVDNSAVPLRQAFCVLQSPPSYDVFEVLLTLTGFESPCVEQVTSWKKVNGSFCFAMHRCMLV